MSRTLHCCLSVNGALRNTDKELSGYFTDENGHPLKGATAIAWLKLQQAHGRKVVPLGQLCEGFSYETGCPGHESAALADGGGR